MKLPSELLKLFERDLERLNSELNEYKKEEDLWKVSGDTKNPAGNLILHICGNLKHFVGATLCKTDYVRDREAEFTGKATKAELAENIRETKELIRDYLERASVDNMTDPYPLQPFGYPMTKSEFLIHLYGHLNWHMGHVNYHRRLLF